MNFEQKNGGEHCTADNSPQYVFHCDADENEFAGFILKNLPLVRAVARRFSGRGAEPEELVQAGSVGLIIAAKSFDKTEAYLLQAMRSVLSRAKYVGLFAKTL